MLTQTYISELFDLTKLENIAEFRFRDAVHYQPIDLDLIKNLFPKKDNKYKLDLYTFKDSCNVYFKIDLKQLQRLENNSKYAIILLERIGHLNYIKFEWDGAIVAPRIDNRYALISSLKEYSDMSALSGDSFWLDGELYCLYKTFNTKFISDLDLEHGSKNLMDYYTSSTSWPDQYKDIFEYLSDTWEINIQRLTSQQDIIKLLSGTVNEHETQLNTLLVHVSELQKDRNSMRHKLHKMQNNFQIILQRNSDLESEIDSLITEKENSEETISNIQIYLHQIKSEFSDLRKDLTTKDFAIEVMQKNLNELNKLVPHKVIYNYAEIKTRNSNLNKEFKRIYRLTKSLK